MSGVSQETCMLGKLLPVVYVCTNFLRQTEVFKRGIYLYRWERCFALCAKQGGSEDGARESGLPL